MNLMTRKEWLYFAFVFAVWITMAFLWGAFAGFDPEFLDSCQDFRPRGC